ncbi:hypothetical protein [Kitasatospora purpeofusca]|uniref:hypothetical protein n=1 Tax=Kitasatospora purpeofusca TaxID=67352 RepID=UPI003F4AE7B7
MIAHLQRATSTAALIPALYGNDAPRNRLRPRLIAADYRSADKQLPLLSGPEEVLREGVLDAPAARIGPRAPERPVWMCSVRSDPRHPDLTDAQWADVARRLVSATGLAPVGDPDGSRWVAIRTLDRSVHIVATVVREDGSVRSTYRDAFHAQAECNRIATDLGHLTRPTPSLTTAKHCPVPGLRITIRLEPSGGVVAKGGSDDLTSTLLRQAGFRQIEDWYGRRHRLPSTTSAADRATIATHAAEMLRAVRYSVDLDPRLDTDLLTGRTSRHAPTTVAYPAAATDAARATSPTVTARGWDAAMSAAAPAAAAADRRNVLHHPPRCPGEALHGQPRRHLRHRRRLPCPPDRHPPALHLRQSRRHLRSIRSAYSGSPCRPHSLNRFPRRQGVAAVIRTRAERAPPPPARIHQEPSCLPLAPVRRRPPPGPMRFSTSSSASSAPPSPSAPSLGCPATSPTSWSAAARGRRFARPTRCCTPTFCGRT